MPHDVHFHGCVLPLIGLVSLGTACCKLPVLLTCSSQSFFTLPDRMLAHAMFVPPK